MEEIQKQSHGFKTEVSALLALLAIALVSLLGILTEINKKYSVEFPADGGALREGVVGNPRFMNPILAQTDADRDLVSLLYTGLFRYDNYGKLQPALAKEYSVSEDGMEYAVTLKDNLYWQDGEKLSADDVIFTIQEAKNPQTQSPRRPNWEGVEIEKIDDVSVRFRLKKAYAPFLENLTLGIIPKHIWEDVPPNQIQLAKLNINPIGAGPYKLKSVKKNALGSIIASTLSANKYFVLGGSPHISKVELRFYQNEEAAIKDLRTGIIDSLGALSPKYLESINTETSKVASVNLRRIIAVFLNQSTNKDLASSDVRRALSLAVDRKLLVEKILAKKGVEIGGPLPHSVLGEENDEAAYDPELAKNLLSKRKNEVKFTLTTANTPELIELANLLKNMWEAVGVKVDIKVFDIIDLEQLVIGPRRYEAFLYGQEVVGENPDPFAFWHSSQRAHPGYNIALYANSQVDKLLEAVRAEKDANKRKETYQSIQKEIKKDLPAIFLFSPSYIYVLPKNIGGTDIRSINAGSDRFSDVANWYLNKQYVWKIFLK